MVNGFSNLEMLLLIENVVVGNQIIVRAPSSVDSALIIEFLKRLLPVECCEARPFSDSYLETYECNFLGIPPSVEIPDHVSISSTFIIGILFFYIISIYKVFFFIDNIIFR